MEFLNSVICGTAGFKGILRCVDGAKLPVEASGLSDIHKALIISALSKMTRRKMILITPDEADATRLADRKSVV